MAGTVVHVLNRAVKRSLLFSEPDDYDAFIRVMSEAMMRFPIRILAFCVMPNHWHFVAWAQEDGDITAFMHWLSMVHAKRWNSSRQMTGIGAVYQGRYKSFPVQNDGHVLRVCRYVERNALRAGLVQRAEDWRWGSLWHRVRGDRLRLLTDGPVRLPADWVELVNTPETAEELEAMRRCSRRGAPLGTDDWARQTAEDWGLTHTLRPIGRPRKETTSDVVSRGLVSVSVDAG